MESPSASALIAPCGMNCGVCIAHLRERNPCPGCRGPDAGKPVTRTRCKIKTCGTLRERNAKYCFECEQFPCERLQHLDKRYRTKYHASVVENLETIKKSGIRKFLADEKRRWTCSRCGGTVSIHGARCSRCGYQESPEGDSLP
ncbi:ribosomal protein S27AE [Methanolinea mesophila]|uniref:DUF3795 domain-containing protein n=1 Tax=Methanolinea mesophila TaxID=547055 RepID=UPI001AE7F6DC|nr:DUF3795 domain-containing protein [Methanolinea mesophila]MBP1928133.1 ribosomal protein S27AE [Methanolinea mesophila]